MLTCYGVHKSFYDIICSVTTLANQDSGSLSQVQLSTSRREVFFLLGQHKSLIMVRDRDHTGALLPGLSINLNWEGSGILQSKLLGDDKQLISFEEQ